MAYAPKAVDARVIEALRTGDHSLPFRWRACSTAIDARARGPFRLHRRQVVRLVNVSPMHRDQGISAALPLWGGDRP
jgi:hypothetical protein